MKKMNAHDFGYYSFQTILIVLAILAFAGFIWSLSGGLQDVTKSQLRFSCQIGQLEFASGEIEKSKELQDKRELCIEEKCIKYFDGQIRIYEERIKEVLDPEYCEELIEKITNSGRSANK